MLTADTAFSIAAVRAEEAARPPGERLFEDPYAQLFHAAGAHAEAGTRRFLDLPFFRDGIRLRTRFIDDVLAAALARGVAQVVLLGAGFDARAHRVPAIAAARVHEVDLPDQLARKRAILAAAGVATPPWLSYVPCDLAEDGALDALAAAGFQREREAIVIWEGVTTYIGVAATERTLRSLATLLAAGSEVVFDAGARFFAPAATAERVLHAGFAACEAVGADALWRRYLAGEPHPSAGAFAMVVARR